MASKQPPQINQPKIKQVIQRQLSESTQNLIDKTKKYRTDEAGIILLQSQKIPQKQIEFTIKLSVDKDFKNVSNISTSKTQIPIETNKQASTVKNPIETKTFTWKPVQTSPSPTASNIPVATNRLFDTSSASLNK